MKNIISVHHSVQADNQEKLKTPSITLMGLAAQAVFQSVKWYGKICIVCGSGNNGGDGYALAILLKDKNFDVSVKQVKEKYTEESKYYFDEVVKNNIPCSLLKEEDNLDADIIVDAILGTGFSEKPTEDLVKIFKKINSSGSFVVSIDIPSGLCGNNGCYKEVINSDLTVAISNYKYGHFLNSAMDVMKDKSVVDIGIPALYDDALLLEENDVKSLFKSRLHESNKGTYGYVGIMGGSKNYPGAPTLAAMGQNALYAGCGVSKLIVPIDIANIMYEKTLEATICPFSSINGLFQYNEKELDSAVKGLKALSIGVGIGKSEDIKLILEHLIKTLEIPLVIDADGLNNLAEMDLNILKESNAKIILTPHLKEFSRLNNLSIEEIKENEVEIVKDFASKYQVILLLKGPTTIVSDGMTTYFIERGTPGMATAGSGDVLTGILTGMLGYMSDDLTKVVAASAFINGMAGEFASSEYGDISMVASDTARCVSKVIKKLCN